MKRDGLAPPRKSRSPRSIPLRAKSSTIPRRSGSRCSTAGRAALKDIGAQSVAAIGITNQRETTIVWERATGKPLANAIVWQDRRTAQHCDELKGEGWGAHVEETTGLVIDPYFSATKLAWLLANVPGLQERARRGEVCFGTVDSFLLFKLTGGKVHAIEASNAARTMLYDIRSGTWDDRLLDRLAIPREILPELRDSQGDFGVTAAEHFGAAIPIRGIAGDQQAAAYGQACFLPGHAEGDLRHRLLSARQYRRGESRLDRAHARDRVSSASKASAPSRSRDRSSWPAPRCNGFATALA